MKLSDWKPSIRTLKYTNLEKTASDSGIIIVVVTLLNPIPIVKGSIDEREIRNVRQIHIPQPTIEEAGDLIRIFTDTKVIKYSNPVTLDVSRPNIRIVNGISYESRPAKAWMTLIPFRSFGRLRRS